ncbi:LuxR C-terminal-related transcriptional regulator [Streptomyces sp. NPDC051597]|uniref:LuxR C-terminal-related transcriptional regulator n=1 Tax=Streptomyces sp. NPDC051597 TaxID=3155049 RepID=UPI0034321476
MSITDTRPAIRNRPLLTPKRAEMLTLAANGHGDKQIARVMGCTLSTVKTQMRWTCRRLGVDDRTHAVAVALRLGLISLSAINIPAPDPARRPGRRAAGAAR